MASTPLPSTFDDGHRFCAYKNGTGCDWQAYEVQMIGYGVGLLVAGLCIISFFAFVILRAFNWCGSRTPTTGVFAGGQPKTYTKHEISLIKIATIIVIIPIIFGVVYSLTADRPARGQVNVLATSFGGSTADLVPTVDSVSTEILKMKYTKNLTSLTAATHDSAVDIDERMRFFDEKSTSYERIREAILYVGMYGAALLCAVALACVFFNLRRLSFAAGLFAFWICAVAWASFGGHMIATKMLADLCTETTTFIEVSQELNYWGALGSVWGCGASSYLDRVNTALYKGRTSGVTDACRNFNNICKYFNVHCPSGVTCNADTLNLFIQQTTIDDAPCKNCDSIARSVKECATECKENYYRVGCANITQADALITNYTRLISDFEPYATCQYAQPALLSLEPLFCKSMRNSFYSISVGCLIAAIFLIALVVLLIMGYKRFLPLPLEEEKKPEEDTKPRSNSNTGLLNSKSINLKIDEKDEGATSPSGDVESFVIDGNGDMKRMTIHAME